MTLLSAATFRSPGATADTTLLAWATRGTAAQPALTCEFITCPLLDPLCQHCQSERVIQPLEVRFANSTTIESTGFTRAGGTGQLVRVGTTDPFRASSIAVVPWNRVTGDATGATLIARDAGGSTVYWADCTASSCGVLQPIRRLGGFTVQSLTPIAAAVEHTGRGPAGRRRVVLVRTDSASTTYFPRNQILVDFIEPTSGDLTISSTVALVTAPGVVDPPPLSVMTGSNISTAFNAADDLLVFFEGGEEAADPTDPRFRRDLALVYTAFVPGGALRSAGATRAIARYIGGHLHASRAAVSSTVVSGATTPLFAVAPGIVPAVIFDDRTGIIAPASTGRLDWMQRRVRGFMPRQEQDGVRYDFLPILDGAIDAPHVDFDDVATLVFHLCPTIGGFGTLGREGSHEVTNHGLRLRNPAGGTPLRCPSALANSADSALVVNRMMNCAYGCPPGQNCRSLEADIANVVDVLSDPGVYASPQEPSPPVSLPTYVTGTAPNSCFVGQEQFLGSTAAGVELPQDVTPVAGP